MSDPFVKIYRSILKSSLWVLGSKELRLLFVAMLAEADPDGVIRSSLPGLADLAKITIPETVTALEELMSPDPHDSSGVEGGVRVVKVPGGWQIVNAKRYRERRSAKQIANAEAAKRYREKKAAEKAAKGETSPKSPDAGMTNHRIITDQRSSSLSLSRSGSSSTSQSVEGGRGVGKGEPAPLELAAPEPPEEPKPKKAKRKRPHPLPYDWTPPPGIYRWARCCLLVEMAEDAVDTAIAEFRDYWISKGDAKADWDAAFRNWLRRNREQDPSGARYRRQAARPELLPWGEESFRLTPSGFDWTIRRLPPEQARHDKRRAEVERRAELMRRDALAEHDPEIAATAPAPAAETPPSASRAPSGGAPVPVGAQVPLLEG